MSITIHKLKGANKDIGLATLPENIGWMQDPCPCNTAEDTREHHCAVKNTSICPYFRGVEYLDKLLCSYPEKLN